MKAYIQTDKFGNYFNVNAYVANDGFQTLGWETEKYFSIDEIQDNDPAHLVVGGIGNVRKRLVQLGIERTLGEIDYPEELRKYLGRKVLNLLKKVDTKISLKKAITLLFKNTLSCQILGTNIPKSRS